jgi:hypothetical protein
MVYTLIYYSGFLTLKYNFAFLWMQPNKIAIRMVSFPTMVVIAAIIAAGLSLIVSLPGKTNQQRQYLQVQRPRRAGQ